MDADVLDDCQQYFENYDDNPDMSTCPWFIRENPFLLSSAADAQRRGLATRDQALGTSGENCEPVPNIDGRRRVLYCPKGDWVTIKYTVPLRIVSGSEVLWAPVTWSTMKREAIATSIYSQDDTVVALHPVYPADTELAQFSVRWPNPYVHVVPNRGVYRLDFTGDITVFSEYGDYTLKLLGTQARDAIDGSDFAIIVNIKYVTASTKSSDHLKIKSE